MSAQANVPTHPLFRRVTRYKGSEDQLTEILAAVLERVPEVGRLLARAWTEPSRKSSSEVAVPDTSLAHEALTTLPLRSVCTQHTTGMGKRPDLVLRFGPRQQPSSDDVVIWVEDKLGADPHEEQLANYCKELPQDVRAAAVVLLAPRSSLPYAAPEVVPCCVPQRSWQEAGRTILKYCDVETDPIKLFLLKELIAYMREENLTDPEAIRPEHLVALAYRDEAEAALERVCEEASRRIEKWCDKAPGRAEKNPNSPRYGSGYWEAWGLESPPGTWFDWSIDRPAAETDGRSLVFASGLAAEAGSELATTDEEREKQKRLETGIRIDDTFIQFQRISEKRFERLARIAFPEEVLIGRTLEAQAASLADWVIAGFEALTRPLGEFPLPEGSR